MNNLLEDSGYFALIRGRYGYFLVNRNDRYIGRSLLTYGEFSEHEAELFAQICRPGDQIVEIGANIGAHTVRLAQLVGPAGRVLACEPQRVLFQNLCANLALNGLLNVDCRQIALGAEAGIVPIPDIRYDLEGNFGGVAADQFETGVPVPLLRLDDVTTLQRLDLLKVDVEGMEQAVIEGGTETITRHRPVIYIENDRRDQSPALIELLWSLDYRLFWHAPPLFNPDNFAGQQENIFESIISLNMIGVHRGREVRLNGFQEIEDAASFPVREA